MKKELTCYERWALNKQSIDFSARVTDNQGTMGLEIQAPQKYMAKLNELAKEVIFYAMGVIAESFSFSVAEKDSKEESDRVKTFLSSRRADLVNTLLRDGHKAFVMAVQHDAGILEMQYLMRSLQMSTCGKWTRWDGAKLYPDGWHMSDGAVMSDSLSRFLLGSEEKEEKVV